MQIPLGDQKTISFAWKGCDFFGKGEILLHSKNNFGAMLMAFDDT